MGLRDWTLGISEARARWLIDWMMKTVEAKAVDLADLTGIGSTGFRYGTTRLPAAFLGTDLCVDLGGWISGSCASSMVDALPVQNVCRNAGRE